MACNIPGSPFAFVGDPASQITALDLEHPEQSYVVSSPEGAAPYPCTLYTPLTAALHRPEQESIFSASYENRLLVVRQATASSNDSDQRTKRTKTGPVAPAVQAGLYICAHIVPHNGFI